MPAAQPAISAQRWNHRVYRPSATAGSVCRMMMPPMSCRSMENCGSSARIASERADLDHERRELAAARLLLRRRVLVDVLDVDVAGPQVRRGDRHDRGRHQRADADGREGDAGEPAREHLVEQQRHDRVAVGLAGVVGDRRDAGRDGHVAEQGEQPEDEAVRRQRGHVALDDVAVARGEHSGHRVRVEEQRQRRAERQRRVLQLCGAGEHHAVPGLGDASNFFSAAPKISSQPPSL